MTFSFPKERTLCLTVFVVSAALSLWFSSAGFHNTLLEGHEFRQAQTALAARALQTEGWQLAYPLPLFGPPWSAPFEFPLYEYVTAKLSSPGGLAIEPAGRLVSLAFFYLGLPACFMLLRDFRLPSHRRFLFLSALLLSPIYLYYSRAVMIESTAWCAGVWFLLAYQRALTTGAARWIAAAIPLGVLASLTKVTTFIVFLAVAAVYTLWTLYRIGRHASEGRGSIGATIMRALTSATPGVAVGILWVRFTDRVKHSNPLTEFLTSGALRDFAFGSFNQRFSPVFWGQMFTHTATSVLPGFALAIILTFALLWGREYRARTGLLLFGYLVGPVTFANLYFVHDYYFYASSVFLIAALALAWSQLLDLPAISPPGKWLIIVACLATQVYGFTQTYFRLQDPRRPAPPVLGHTLSVLTEPDDVILIYGLDWNPILPYYAHRRAIMVPEIYARDRPYVDNVIRRLPPGKIGALVVVGDFRRNESFLSDLAGSLSLTERPLLTSGDTQVFLAQRLVSSAAKILPNISVPGFDFAVPIEPVVPGVKWQRYIVAAYSDQSAFDMMSPHPVEVFAPFGIAVAIVDGRRVFNAHAPTDIIFNIPRGARKLRAGFGLLPDAYGNGHSLDGVHFVIEQIGPTGEHAYLFDQFLNPTEHTEDRGMHHLEVSLPPDASGRIVLSVRPSPRNNISYNWAYWTDLSIR